MMLGIIASFVSNPHAAINALMASYGYAAVFVLMLLESSSIPVPSEVVLPLAGFFAAKGVLDFLPALVVAMLGSIGGLAIDYAIGYYLGKDVIYAHLSIFHVKKRDLDAFDAWFDRNAIAAVFLSRLLPVVRTVMSFPAGFAKMPLKEFFAYSILGSFIWDVVLMAFGFYALSANSAVMALGAIGVFAIALYIIYAAFMRRIRKHAR